MHIRTHVVHLYRVYCVILSFAAGQLRRVANAALQMPFGIVLLALSTLLAYNLTAVPPGPKGSLEPSGLE